MRRFRLSAELRGGIEITARFPAEDERTARTITRSLLEPHRAILEGDAILSEERHVIKAWTDPADDRLIVPDGS